MAKRLNIVRTLITLLLLGLHISGTACIWDTDTLADEAKNYGNVVDVMTGRFPRNPPLYYEMRLARVEKEVLLTPDKLDLYDDAGVACDHLNRGDAAFGWMNRKFLTLKKLGDFEKHKDDWYRYHANLGTFQAHEWIRKGAETTATAMLEMGAKNIEIAIEINPDAHFGREKYQLAFLQWILSKRKPITEIRNTDVGREKVESREVLTSFLTDMLVSNSGAERPDKKALEDASKGLLGLVYLGNAWESVDVFYTLEQIHDVLGNASIRQLASYRVKELMIAGKKPIMAPNMATEQFQELSRYSTGMFYDSEEDVAVKELRENAHQWQEHRSAFMIESLKKGMHPDTDPDFWNGYVEIPRSKPQKLKVPKTNNSVKNVHSAASVSWSTIVGLIVCCGLFVLLVQPHLKNYIKRSGAGDRT